MKAENLRELYALIGEDKTGTRESRFVKFLKTIELVDPEIYRGLEITTQINGESIAYDNVSQWEKSNNWDKPEDRVHMNIFQQLRSDKLAYKRNEGANRVKFPMHYESHFIGYVNV